MNATNHTDDQRKRDLARIHVAKKKLGLDDDTYRDMLWTIGRVRSAAHLDSAGRRQVIVHLKSRGFKPSTSKARRKNYPGRPHNCDEHPQLRKIEALLTDAKRPWAYADAMAKKMFAKDRLTFCNSQEWGKIISALEYDKRRHHG